MDDKVNEILYRYWLDKMSQKYGVQDKLVPLMKHSYNPNDPMYNYRLAFLLGLSPQWQSEHQQYRWSDVGKQKGYVEQD